MEQICLTYEATFLVHNPSNGLTGWHGMSALQLPLEEREEQAHLGVAQDDPIVWQSAIGSNVVDVDGNCFVDLTAGFGVAGAGHRNEKSRSGLAAAIHTAFALWEMRLPDPQRIKINGATC